MKLKKVLGTVGVLLAGFTLGVQARDEGAARTQHYRNLFVEGGHAPQEVSAKIDAAYQQLFHGDPATQAVYYRVGTNNHGALAYIYDVASKDVRTEGLSYGMMISVQLNHKPEFDALWNWAMTYLYQTNASHPTYGFFSWSAQTNGVANDEMPAPDGEEYFVTSLYFASARWGNGTGIYDYQAQADRLLEAMLHRPVITGTTIKGEKSSGALFDADHKMVRFTPDVLARDHTDPSYHLPAFYTVWSLCGPKQDRHFWAEAATASRDFFPLAANSKTGLTPDHADFDGTPWASPWNAKSVDFRYDSWRTAMNWSVDWAWWSADPREQELSDRLQSFFESKGMTNYGELYKITGEELAGHHGPGLAAMNAVASLAATNPRAKAFVEELWNTPPPDGLYRYYGGMLYLMGYLHCAGEFRAWVPSAANHH